MQIASEAGRRSSGSLVAGLLVLKEVLHNVKRMFYFGPDAGLELLACQCQISLPALDHLSDRLAPLGYVPCYRMRHGLELGLHLVPLLYSDIARIRTHALFLPMHEIRGLTDVAHMGRRTDDRMDEA